jgi:hypothetical protein
VLLPSRAVPDAWAPSQCRSVSPLSCWVSFTCSGCATEALPARRLRGADTWRYITRRAQASWAPGGRYGRTSARSFGMVDLTFSHSPSVMWRLRL